MNCRKIAREYLESIGVKGFELYKCIRSQDEKREGRAFNVFRNFSRNKPSYIAVGKTVDELKEIAQTDNDSPYEDLNIDNFVFDEHVQVHRYKDYYIGTVKDKNVELFYELINTLK